MVIAMWSKTPAKLSENKMSSLRLEHYAAIIKKKQVGQYNSYVPWLSQHSQILYHTQQMYEEALE